MVQGYWPLLFQLAFGFGFVALILVIAHVIRPKLKKKSDSKPDTFECGVAHFQDAKGLFNVKFYMIAVLFILFDVEAIFLFPWAVAFKSFKSIDLGGFIVAEMFVFLAILVLGYIYILKKGGLDWESPD